VLGLCLGYLAHHSIVFRSYPCIVHLGVAQLESCHGCSDLVIGLVLVEHLVPTLDFRVLAAVQVLGVACPLVASFKAAASVGHFLHFLLVDPLAFR
jgi:hypothetical protein